VSRLDSQTDCVHHGYRQGVSALRSIQGDVHHLTTAPDQDIVRRIHTEILPPITLAASANRAHIDFL
jgi:hypothetical protein